MVQHDAVSPFLKWAGGKRWFVERYHHLIPAQYSRYIEPFLGSAAVFFAQLPPRAILSDLNEDLISTYLAVRDYPSEVEEILALHQRSHGKEHYYKTRAEKPDGMTERAARLIYLNRTCWNGLYRVNRKNEFNVPIGTKTNVLLPTDDFLRVSEALSKADILCRDFESTIDAAADGDFVFVDPPYTVKHNLNGFVKYNDRIFSWADQVRLRDAVVRAAARGAMVLVTNANHQSVRELYEGCGEATVLRRASVLAANKDFRTATEEIFIRTWAGDPQWIALAGEPGFWTAEPPQ